MRQASATRTERLHRRGLRLEWFTVSWNVVEGFVAVGAGLIAGSVSLVGFGADSFIEVISAIVLLWRLRRAGPDATIAETGAAERRALYLVAGTFFLLSVYIAFESVGALLSGEGLESSAVGLVLAALSILIMPTCRATAGAAPGARAGISAHAPRAFVEIVGVVNPQRMLFVQGRWFNVPHFFMLSL